MIQDMIAILILILGVSVGFMYCRWLDGQRK